MSAFRLSKQAVAYIRVSTEKQGEDGIGLDAQRAAIRAYADKAGVHVLEWFQDVASGRGEKNLERREGLRNALKLAADQNADVLVDGFDRLSRSTKTIEHIIRDMKVPVISVSDGHTADPLVIASKAARAELEGNVISQRTKEALRAKKAAGVLLGNKTNLPEAQRRGAEANKRRFDEKAKEIADAIHRNGWEQLSAPQLVEALNGLGLRSGRNQTWTIDGLRRPLRQARLLLSQTKNKHYASIPGFGLFGST